MGRASIADAFNAAINFSNQSFGYATKELKDRNEFAVKKNEYDVQVQIQNWIRDNPFVGSENEEGDELAYQNYLARFKKEGIDKAYNDVAKKNSSGYYKEQMERSRQLAYSSAVDIALNKADKYRTSRELVGLGEDYKNYQGMIKSGDWTPQQALEASYNRIELTRTKIDITPEEYNNMRKAAETGAYQIYSMSAIDKATDVNDLDAIINEVHESFSFMKPVQFKVYDDEWKKNDDELKGLKAKKESGKWLDDDEQKRYDELKNEWKRNDEELKELKAKAEKEKRLDDDEQKRFDELKKKTSVSDLEGQELSKYNSMISQRSAEADGRINELNEIVQNPRTEERPWTYDGRDEWDKKLKDKAMERITGEHFAAISDKQATMERLIIAGNLDGAIAEANVGRALLDRYYNPKDTMFNNYTREYRDRSSHYFDVGKLERYKKQGDVGKAMILLDSYNLDMFVQPQMPGGDGNVIVGYDSDGKPIIKKYKSLEEAKQGFLYYKREAFMYDKRNKGIEDYVALQMWEAERSEFINKYYDKIETTLRNVAPNSLAVFQKFRKTETFLNEKDNPFYSNELKKIKDPEQRDRFAQRCINFFESIFFNGITDEATINQMMRDFTGNEIMIYLEEQKFNYEDPKKQYEQMKAFSDKAKNREAENIIYTIYNPNRLDVNGANQIVSYDFRSTPHENAVNSFANEERKQLSYLLGTKIDDMKMQWMPSDIIQNDVIPKAMFIVGEGKDAVAYHLEYQDGNYVAMKGVKDENGKYKWVEDKSVQRQLNPREQEQQRVREIGEVKNITRTGVNPINGQKINITTAPPNDTADSYWRSHQTSVYNKETGRWEVDASKGWAEYYIELQKNPAVTVDKVVKKGKNPITGETINFDIPASTFKGQYHDWQKMKLEEKQKLLIEDFVLQITNSGK